MNVLVEDKLTYFDWDSISRSHFWILGSFKIGFFQIFIFEATEENFADFEQLPSDASAIKKEHKWVLKLPKKSSKSNSPLKKRMNLIKNPKINH